MTPIVYIFQMLWDTLNPFHALPFVEPFGDLLDILLSGILAFVGS